MISSSKSIQSMRLSYHSSKTNENEMKKRMKLNCIKDIKSNCYLSSKTQRNLKAYSRIKDTKYS